MINRLKPNGKLPIQLGWKHAKLKLDITGGPFDAYPTFSSYDTFGVCVRAEQVPASLVDVNLAISDFSVPRDAIRTGKAIRDTMQAALDGKRVYIGCMGGWGRTGLFMALIAKAAGIKNPVEFVRETYTPKAVETREQQLYVDTFDVEEIQKWLVVAAWRARFRRLFS
ncbi:hypothetical protein [Nitratireductor sp. OM-1]|uniref:protein-tyrosine phosphatase family protein n=1 Tax=Nitratireductor sp. OM-1 TaxID=1756988 RepID=UPI000DE0A119|nr:hypothetical protein [Nitratireductor sp. OM-1]